MVVKYSFIVFLSFFIFVEMQPFMSISQDLSIISGCNATSPVDKRTLNTALIEKRFGQHVDENFKCFLHCLYHKYKWMNEDGAFLHEEMKRTLVESNLDESSIEYLLVTCTETEVEDKCERAYQLTECFWTETEKLLL